MSVKKASCFAYFYPTLNYTYLLNTVDVVRLDKDSEVKDAIADAKNSVKTEYYQGVSNLALLTLKEMAAKEC